MANFILSVEDIKTYYKESYGRESRLTFGEIRHIYIETVKYMMGKFKPSKEETLHQTVMKIRSYEKEHCK